MSMGEHSMVRLVKAISFEPSLLVLDELSAILSPNSKESLLSAILSLFANRKVSDFYICHSREEALRLLDRIYEMTTSGLQIKGGPSE